MQLRIRTLCPDPCCVQGCAYCGGLGHRISDCPKLETTRQKTTSATKARSFAFATGSARRMDCFGLEDYLTTGAARYTGAEGRLGFVIEYPSCFFCILGLGGKGSRTASLQFLFSGSNRTARLRRRLVSFVSHPYGTREGCGSISQNLVDPSCSSL